MSMIPLRDRSNGMHCNPSVRALARDHGLRDAGSRGVLSIQPGFREHDYAGRCHASAEVASANELGHGYHDLWNARAGWAARLAMQNDVDPVPYEATADRCYTEAPDTGYARRVGPLTHRLGGAPEGRVGAWEGTQDRQDGRRHLRAPRAYRDGGYNGDRGTVAAYGPGLRDDWGGAQPATQGAGRTVRHKARDPRAVQDRTELGRVQFRPMNTIHTDYGIAVPTGLTGREGERANCGYTVRPMPGRAIGY